MSTQVTFRIDNNLKGMADAIFDKIGITMTDAFRIFLKKVVSDGGIPFDLKVDKMTYVSPRCINEDEIIPADFMDDIWDD